MKIVKYQSYYKNERVCWSQNTIEIEHFYCEIHVLFRDSHFSDELNEFFIKIAFLNRSSRYFYRSDHIYTWWCGDFKYNVKRGRRMTHRGVVSLFIKKVATVATLIIIEKTVFKNVEWWPWWR